MLIETALFGTASLLYLNWDEIMIKKRFNKILKACNIKNHLGKTIKVWEIEKTEFGYNMKIEMPFGYTFDDIQSNFDVFEQGMMLESIQLRPVKGNVAILNCIENKEYKEYRPVPLPPYQLLIADGLENSLVADMNQYPHLILGGDPGAGKSRTLMVMLTNLVVNTTKDNAKIYLMQRRKNDVSIFKYCEQVISYSNTLEEIREALKEIENEAIKRDELIDASKGINNIEDYNKYAEEKLPYLYVVVDEFSFLNVDKADNGNEKSLKQECLKDLKAIVRAGRSAGIFFITSLQRPTNDSIPSEIKTLITTRISLVIKDNAPAEVIMGNNSPTKLVTREVMVRTLGEEIGKSYTINYKLIKKYIKDKEIDKPKEKEKNNSLPPLLINDLEELDEIYEKCE